MRLFQNRYMWAGCVALASLTVLYGQYGSGGNRRRSGGLEWEMQEPTVDPPDAGKLAEYTFARLRYRSFRRGDAWGTDANKSERQFVQGVRRLTRIDTRSVEKVVDVDSDEMYDWPWMYAVEPGQWTFSEEQGKRLRAYFDRGGFLMVDDFHGAAQWDSFLSGLHRIFPGSVVVDLPDDNAIFHIVYDLDQRFQVPALRSVMAGTTYQGDGVQPYWRAVVDDQGRVQVAICFNMDIGDAWQSADLPQYPERYASLGYRIGVNYILYSMTH